MLESPSYRNMAYIGSQFRSCTSVVSCATYHITVYLHEVQIFMNFTNGHMNHENLCWIVSKVQLWVLVGAWISLFLYKEHAKKNLLHLLDIDCIYLHVWW